jgi:hypothetical protein
MRLPTLLAVLCFAAPAFADPEVALRTQTVVATVNVQPRFAVSLSSERLEFVVPPGSHEAVDVIGFSAGARAMPDAGVVLVVEAGSITGGGPGGSAKSASLSYTTASGSSAELSPFVPQVIATWTGGGLRRGELRFTLRDVPPGIYTAPIRVTVSAP